MKRIAILLILSAFSITAFAQTTEKQSKEKKELKGVAIDLTQFSGAWYSISRLPNALDKNLKNVLVTYALHKESKIKEVFTGEKENGKQLKIKSTLTYKGEGIIKGPLGKKYLVLEVGDKYDYFVMATADRKYLWIMARTKTLDNNTYNSILSHLVTMKFEPTQLVKMVQQ